MAIGAVAIMRWTGGASYAHAIPRVISDWASVSSNAIRSPTLNAAPPSQAKRLSNVTVVIRRPSDATRYVLVEQPEVTTIRPISDLPSRLPVSSHPRP